MSFDELVEHIKDDHKLEVTDKTYEEVVAIHDKLHSHKLGLTDKTYEKIITNHEKLH